MVMEPGTLADARKAQEPIGWQIYGLHDREGTFAPVGSPLARYLGLSGAGERAAAPVPENPATCDHRADVLWLAHRLRISEHRVADLTRQKKQLERRLRKAKRGRRK